MHNVFNVYHTYSKYPLYYIGKMSSKILWSQNRNNGAKQTAIYITSANCFIILYTFWTSMIKYNMYYRPDMGWEPVWYGLWIKMAEITKKISRNIIQLKGALFLRIITNFQNYSPHDKNETEPVWLSPFLPFFRPPHARLYA